MAREATAPFEAQTSAVIGEVTTSTWLVFRAAAHQCAIPLEQVIESMRPLPIEVVAGGPPCVRGLCMIRGAAVPVVDAGLLLGERTVAPERIITIKIGGRVIALLTGAILGIRAIRPDAAAALPPLLREAAGQSIAAIGTLDTGLLLFLRAAKIVPAEVLDRLKASGAST
jgi:purine-binding chemotaxis protein CheW